MTYTPQVAALFPNGLTSYGYAWSPGEISGCVKDWSPDSGYMGLAANLRRHVSGKYCAEQADYRAADRIIQKLRKAALIERHGKAWRWANV